MVEYAAPEGDILVTLDEYSDEPAVVRRRQDLGQIGRCDRIIVAAYFRCASFHCGKVRK